MLKTFKNENDITFRDIMKLKPSMKFPVIDLNLDIAPTKPTKHKVMQISLRNHSKVDSDEN